MADPVNPREAETPDTLQLIDELLRIFENSREGSAGPLPKAARVLRNHFPRQFFKLQELGGDGYLRVRPEFTTPLLATLVHDTEIEGSLSVLLESEVGFAGCPELREGVLSSEPVQHTERSTIARFLEAHFSDGAVEGMSHRILSIFEFSRLYLFPIRKAGLPFGVISLLTPQELAAADLSLWRIVSRMIGFSCARRDLVRQNTMKSHVLVEVDEPVAIITAAEEVLVVSRRLQDVLRETDSLRVRRSILRAHHYWRSIGKRDAAVAITVGGDVAVPMRIHEQQLFDTVGVLLGYALWIGPDESVEVTQSTAFSDRELTVLHLIAKGCSSKEIADRLHRSVHTVQYHRSALRKKLRVTDSTLSFQQIAALVVSGLRG